MTAKSNGLTIATFLLILSARSVWAGVGGSGLPEGESAPPGEDMHGQHHVDAAGTREVPGAEPLCPVGGEKIDRKVFIETKQGRVYFCCPKCIKPYEADPAKYATKVHAQRLLLGGPRVQVTCPVTGKPIDPKISLDHHGQKVYFCCKNCPAKFEKHPADFLAKAERCYTTQTTCPVSGEPIDPTVFVVLKDAERVYFCCAKCVGKFDSSREKYLKELKARGGRTNPTGAAPDHGHP